MQIEAVIDVQVLYEIIPYGSFQYFYYNLQDSVNLSKKGTLLNIFLYGVQNFIQNADVIYATLKQKNLILIILLTINTIYIAVSFKLPVRNSYHQIEFINCEDNRLTQSLPILLLALIGTSGAWKVLL